MKSFTNVVQQGFVVERGLVAARNHQQSTVPGLDVVQVDEDDEVVRVDRAILSQAVARVAATVAVAVPTSAALAGAALMLGVKRVPDLSHGVVDNQRADARPPAAQVRLAPCQLAYDRPEPWVHRQLLESRVERKRQSQMASKLPLVPRVLLPHHLEAGRERGCPMKHRVAVPVGRLAGGGELLRAQRALHEQDCVKEEVGSVRQARPRVICGTGCEGVRERGSLLAGHSQPWRSSMKRSSSRIVIMLLPVAVAARRLSVASQAPGRIARIKSADFETVKWIYLRKTGETAAHQL